MWKTFGVIIFCVILSVIVGILAREKVRRDLAAPVAYPTTTPGMPTPTDSPLDASETTALFVPYWTLQQDLPGNYNRYLYFGIIPTKTGIDMKEQGNLSLPLFLKQVPPDKKKLLTLRMIDSQNNFAILKDPAKQQVIIAETLALAKENEFDGVLLDLEVSAVPFESLVNQITGFTTRFAQATKKEHLWFSTTIYGDVFYRIRPFAIKEIAKQSDEVMIMAYDFSKARGNPGPNFPLKGKEVYGYDMTKMVVDFLDVMDPKKLTVVFGLYGYDWEVDDNGIATSQGKALTYNEITEQFLGECGFIECTVRRKNDSAETEIRYVDADGKKHLVWFEDPESVEKKKRFLKQKGITSFAFWAHGYF